MPAPSKYLDNPACVEAILARWPDDRRFYKVSLVSRDAKNNKSMVKFEDGEIHPIENNELHIQLDLDKVGDEAIICCLCESDKSEIPNLIIICDLCQLGYHVGCHKPPIEQAFVDDSDKEWYCDTCLEITNPERRKKKRRTSEDSVAYQTTPKRQSVSRKKLTPEQMPNRSKKIITTAAAAAKKTKNLDKLAVVVRQENLEDDKAADKRLEPIREEILEEAPGSEVALVASNVEIPAVDPRLPEGQKVKELEDGSVVEEMSPILIQSATDLSELVKTADFVSSITPPPRPDADSTEPRENRSVKGKKVKFARVKKAPVKSNSVKPEPA